jgi:hypothetical protein
MPASKTQSTEKSVYTWLTFIVTSLVWLQDNPHGLGLPRRGRAKSDIAELNPLKIITAKLKELDRNRL